VVLDDYQKVAASFAEWDRVDGDVRFVHEHVQGDELVAALRDASVVVAMRERTAFDEVLTAHLGYVTDGSYRVFYTDAVEDVLAWQGGTPLRVIAP
jgi:phosphoglycerate dehydrogenase-like enzyme